MSDPDPDLSTAYGVALYDQAFAVLTQAQDADETAERVLDLMRGIVTNAGHRAALGFAAHLAANIAAEYLVVRAANEQLQRQVSGRTGVAPIELSTGP